MKLWPKRLQFSLRTMLLVVIGASVLLGWLFHGPIAQKWRHVRAIEAAGSTVLIEIRGPEWLRAAGAAEVVDHFRARPYAVFAPREFKDDDLKIFAALNEMEWLSLEGTRVTDKGLKHLYGLTDLRILYLQSTSVTEEGVRELEARLPELIVSR